MSENKSIYKYTAINDSSLDNLKHNRLYAQSPNMFNDPYEFIFRFEFPDEHLIPFLKLIYGDQHQKFIEMKSTRKDILKWSRDFYFNEHRNAVGAACFTEDARNELLWAHYGDNHKGMCLEFDSTKDPFKQIMQVEYVKEVPVITYQDLTGTTDIISRVMTKPFLTKPDIWSYEKEWRILTEANSFIQYVAGSILSITFGFFCPTELKQKVMDVTAHLSITYYEIIRAKDSYRIERVPIELTHYL
jgi:hypothetical protein